MNDTQKHKPGDIVEVEHPSQAVPSNVIPFPALDLPKTEFDKIADAVAAASAEIAENPVLKEGKNSFHGYNFAKMQDIVEHVSPILSKHGLTITQTERDRGFMDRGNAIFAVYDFVLIHKSGQVWPVIPRATGVANTRTSKGTFDDKGLAKCHTAARKSMLISFFNIPTTDDPDRHTASRPKEPPPIQPAAGKQPPVDVNKPGPLATIQGEKWEAWSDRLLQVIHFCGQPELAEEWMEANHAEMDELRKALPAHHAFVMRQYNKHLLKLQPAEPTQ